MLEMVSSCNENEQVNYVINNIEPVSQLQTYDLMHIPINLFISVSYCSL